MDIFKSLKSNRLEFIILLSLSALVIISRIPFITKFLYDEDSVNYALAFNNYNITLYQPHPPGYILFVGSGKTVNFFLGEPNLSMIFLSILLSILTVFIIYFLGKDMFSRKFGLLAAVLLVFNPIFWLYGEIAASYMSGAFFATLIVYTSYRVLKGDNRFFYVSSIILGLSGGFRQDLVLFMFPMWLYCITYKNKEIKKIITAFLVLIASVLLWFAPTLILAGGYEIYSLVSKNLLISGSFSIHSVLFGADIMENLLMDARVLFWSVIGIGIMNTFILIIFIFYKIRFIKLSSLRNSKTILIALWIIPAFLFYLLVFFAKPGYILIILPSFALIMAYVIINFSSDLNKRFSKVSTNIFIIFLLSISLASGIIQFAHPYENSLYSVRIQSEDRNYQNIYDSVGRFSSKDTLIFFDDNVNWRKTMYYYPEYEIYSYYTILAIGKTHQELIHYKNGKTEISTSKIFRININPTTTKIIWLIDTNSEFFKELQSKIEIKALKLTNGHIVYYSDISNVTNFQIQNFNFIRE